MGDNFICLGKRFSFYMSNVDNVYNFTSTWVIQNLDSIVKGYTTRWLRLPQSANTRHLDLPVKRLGMKFTLPSDAYNSSQLTTRNILKQSKNPEIRDLYKATAPKNVETDTLLHQDKPKNPKDRMVNKIVKKMLDDMKGVKEQNIIMDSISQQCSSSSINQWQKVDEGFPQNIFIFVHKEVILQLANNTNLFKWKKVFSSDCDLCNTTKQAQLYMLNNCFVVVRNDRYTWRYGAILFTICHYLTALENTGFKLFADLAGFKNLEVLFNAPRPDIVVKNGNNITVIELSCCYETK